MVAFFLHFSGSSTPFTSAPSSPPPQPSASFLHFSALASTTAAKLYAELTHNPSLKDADFTFLSASSVPSQWEASPGVAKARAAASEDERGEFEFDFSGRIMPLKPPPGLQVGRSPTRSASGQHTRRQGPGGSTEVESRRVQSQSQPRRAAPRQRSELETRPQQDVISVSVQSRRHSLRRKFTRLRHEAAHGSIAVVSGLVSIPKAYRKWRIKDLLFRSASEGRATEQVAVTESPDSSFRSTETMTSAAGSISRRRSSRVPVPAHELHYKVNRAVSQKLRKKTFLPYKKGLLGCLGFIPSSGSEIGRS